MLQLVSSSRIIVGSSPEIFEALKDRTVLAAIWTGAWSEESLDLAGRIARMPENLAPWRRLIFLPRSHDIKSNAPFDADRRRISNVFRNLGGSLLGPNRVRDHSYIGSIAGTQKYPWHCDVGCGLTLTSNVAGVSTEFLDRIVPQEVEMWLPPKKRDAAEKAARHAPLGSVMVFRGLGFPGEGFNALSHRTPVAVKGSRYPRERLVILQKRTPVRPGF